MSLLKVNKTHLNHSSGPEGYFTYTVQRYARLPRLEALKRLKVWVCVSKLNTVINGNTSCLKTPLRSHHNFYALCHYRNVFLKDFKDLPLNDHVLLNQQ